MKAIDFFCGAGGLTRGLLNVGIEVIAGIDIDSECCQTYEANNPQSRFLAEDIQTLNRVSLVAGKKASFYRDTLFTGCAPCQPFSQQNKQATKDGRETLLSEFARLVTSCLPRAVIIENVPGMMNVKGYSTFRRFVKSLMESKYSISYAVLDAKDYGVPQTRRRLVLLAVRGKEASLPLPTHAVRGRKLVTVRSAISHFPALQAGHEHKTIPNHVAASISEVNLERLRHTPHDGGDRRSWPKRLQLECHKNGHTGHTDVYGRLAWDSPAPTLTARCHSISNGRYGHPEQDRAISLREAAALQSFPDGYIFHGSNKHIAQQIGNAVPVVFAESLGRHLLKLLDD